MTGANISHVRPSRCDCKKKRKKVPMRPRRTSHCCLIVVVVVVVVVLYMYQRWTNMVSQCCALAIRSTKQREAERERERGQKAKSCWSETVVFISRSFHVSRNASQRFLTFFYRGRLACSLLSRGRFSAGRSFLRVVVLGFRR